MRERRLRIRRVAAVALVASMAMTMVVLAEAGPSFGVDQAASGFWWQAEPDTGGVPQPPTVPADGLWVSSTAAGPQAVSALRFSLLSGESAPVVSLTISSSQGSDPPLVQACPTDGKWVSPAGVAGPWSAKPVFDCTTHVPGALNGDSTKMTFDLSSLARTGQVDVALVPIVRPSQLPPSPAPAPAPVPTTLPPLPVPVPTTLPSPVPPPPPAPSPTTESNPTFDITFQALTTSAIAVSAPPVDTPSFTDVPPPVLSAPSTDFSGFAAPPVVDAAPAPSTAPPATAPAAAFRPVARQVSPVKPSKGRSLAERIVLAAALAFLIGMSQERSGSLAKAGPMGVGTGTGTKRPKLSIYDPPPPRSYAAAPVRVGKPPAIR